MDHYYDDMVNRIEDYNLYHLFLLEDTVDFKAGCLLTRKNTERAEKIFSECRYNREMHRRGIHRNSTLLLGGESGSGKTLMVQYIAHQLGLPLATIRYGGLLKHSVEEALLRITEIFEAIRDYPCVLCFDGIDEFFTMQGYKTIDREYEQMILALTQELKHLAPHCVFVATVGDAAFHDASQFFDPVSIPFEMTEQTAPLSREDIHKVGSAYFELAGVEAEQDWEEHLREDVRETMDRYAERYESDDNQTVSLHEVVSFCAKRCRSARN